MSDDKCSQ